MFMLEVFQEAHALGITHLLHAVGITHLLHALGITHLLHALTSHAAAPLPCSVQAVVQAVVQAAMRCGAANAIVAAAAQEDKAAAGVLDAPPRLNARQRRTLRRAKDRAIKGLIEAGQALISKHCDDDSDGQSLPACCPHAALLAVAVPANPCLLLLLLLLWCSAGYSFLPSQTPHPCPPTRLTPGHPIPPPPPQLMPLLALPAPHATHPQSRS